MPYKNIEDLPDSVKDNLPEHAQKIYMESFNNAWKTYADAKERRGGSTQEESAHRVAWAAVKHEYEKDEDSGKWKRKKGFKRKSDD